MPTINLAPNGIMAPPGGYPIRLSPLTDAVAQGVIPIGTVSVTATVKADSTANVHLALYAMPTVSGGSDQAVVVQTDLIGLFGPSQTITVSPPASTVSAPVLPVPYIVRLWVDNVTRSNVETIARDTGVAVASIPLQPQVPGGVTVSSVVLS